MNSLEASLIRSLHHDCVDEGIGHWITEELPTIREAYRLAGASIHEMWDANLIDDAEHDEATCPAGYCVAGRHVDHDEPDPTCQMCVSKANLEELAASSIPKCGACAVHQAKHPATADEPEYMSIYHRKHADG